MTDQLISCDDHMDLSQLPADLWTARLPATLLDRAPHVEERDGQAVWVCDGKVWGRWDGKPPATGSARPIKALYNAFDRAGIHDPSARRPAVAELRLADIIDAQEALRIGLVGRVVPAEQLEHETLKLAERLAQGPTVAYGLAKTGLYQGLGMSLEDVLNMEARNQAMAARTPDRAEGVAAFREKRPPRFTGRAGCSPAR